MESETFPKVWGANFRANKAGVVNLGQYIDEAESNLVPQGQYIQLRVKVDIMVINN